MGEVVGSVLFVIFQIKNPYLQLHFCTFPPPLLEYIRFDVVFTSSCCFTHTMSESVFTHVASVCVLPLILLIQPFSAL